MCFLSSSAEMFSIFYYIQCLYNCLNASLTCDKYLKTHEPKITFNFTKLLVNSTIVEQIVDLGNLISSASPDTKVIISDLTQRYDKDSLSKKVNDCNKVMKTFCNQNGWGFIAHPNIDKTCVITINQ